MKLADLLADEPTVPAGTSLREGQDFYTQQQWGLLQPTETIRYRVQPLVAQLSAALLRELHMLQQTGQLPGDVSWSQQPAWRVELWESFWQTQATAADWPPLPYPVAGEEYE